jgi:hypothetical protein
MIWRSEYGAVGAEEHRGTILVNGYRCFHGLPVRTVERGIVDNLELSPEPVLILPLRFGAHLLSGVIAGEVRAHQK